MEKQIEKDVMAVQVFFSQIYLACHSDHIRARSSKNQISSHDSTILAHLYAPIFRQPKSLAKHLRISPSTLSEWTVRMDELGYLRSKADDEDGRKVVLELTDDGKKVVQDSSVLDTERVAKIFEKMTEEDGKRVMEGLRLLAQYATGKGKADVVDI